MHRLTKPQVAFLTLTMRDPRTGYGPSQRVAFNLLRAGLVEEARGKAPFAFLTFYQPTEAGLRALCDYRRRLWGDRGSMASLNDFEEVEAALEARFPRQVLAA